MFCIESAVAGLPFVFCSKLQLTPIKRTFYSFNMELISYFISKDAPSEIQTK